MRQFIDKILAILDGTPAEYGKKAAGQSAAELALMVPVLLIMLVAIIEMGWFAQNYLNVLEAAKVGARRGPFLTAENAPQNFPGEAVLATISQIGQTATADGLIARNRDVNNAPLSERCGSIPDDAFGFYNLIICTTLDALDPLELQVDDPTTPNDPIDKVYKDDIVVSVFSLQRVNSGSGNAFDIDLNNAFGNTTGYPEGHQVVVVGRWPPQANECTEAGERDPFDYITNGVVDWEYVPNPLGGPDVRMVYELAVWDEETNDYIGYLDTGIERQRGFVWTGRHRVESIGDSAVCYGSEWSSEEVQERMNLPRFIDQGSATASQARLSHLPSQGVVLVEVFWEHRLLLGDTIPVFSPFYNAMGGNDPASTANVIKVWAAFPAPAAEPAILYRPVEP